MVLVSSTIIAAFLAPNLSATLTFSPQPPVAYVSCISPLLVLLHSRSGYEQCAVYMM